MISPIYSECENSADDFEEEDEKTEKRYIIKKLLKSIILMERDKIFYIVLQMMKMQWVIG